MAKQLFPNINDVSSSFSEVNYSKGGSITIDTYFLKFVKYVSLIYGKDGQSWSNLNKIFKGWIDRV